MRNFQDPQPTTLVFGAAGIKTNYKDIKGTIATKKLVTIDSRDSLVAPPSARNFSYMRNAIQTKESQGDLIIEFRPQALLKPNKNYIVNIAALAPDQQNTLVPVITKTIPLQEAIFVFEKEADGSLTYYPELIEYKQYSYDAAQHLCTKDAGGKDIPLGLKLIENIPPKVETIQLMEYDPTIDPKIPLPKEYYLEITPVLEYGPQDPIEDVKSYEVYCKTINRPHNLLLEKFAPLMTITRADGNYFTDQYYNQKNIIVPIDSCGGQSFSLIAHGNFEIVVLAKDEEGLYDQDYHIEKYLMLSPGKIKWVTSRPIQQQLPPLKGIDEVVTLDPSATPSSYLQPFLHP